MHKLLFVNVKVKMKDLLATKDARLEELTQDFVRKINKLLLVAPSFNYNKYLNNLTDFHYVILIF